MTEQISVFISFVSLDYGSHDLYWFCDVNRCTVEFHLNRTKINVGKVIEVTSVMNNNMLEWLIKCLCHDPG